MKLGIIGLPGSGKTTVFEALTGNIIDDGRKNDYRLGTVRVPDPRVNTLSDMYHPQKTIFAQVEYLHPGFVTGVQDKNKDNQTWVQARDCDALIHVIRNFKGFGMAPPTPIDDVHTLDQELILTDLMVIEKRLERVEQEQKRHRSVDPHEPELLDICRTHLEDGIPLRRFHDIATAPVLKGFSLLSAKPVILLFNNNDEDIDLPPDDGLCQTETCGVIRGQLEQELAQLPEAEAEVFLKEFDVAASAMDRVIKQSYAILGLISFFTVGEDEVRAWTIREKTMALDAAEVIHTDIKKGFIRAEVVSYNDLMENGSYNAAKKKGSVRLEGKTYEVQDGDIINFRFNV